MMKKTIVLMLLSACFLTGCNTKTVETEESKSELEKFLKKTSSEKQEREASNGDKMVENVETEIVNIADFNFVIPADFTGDDLKQAQSMRENILKTGELEIYKQPVYITVYGMVYDKEYEMVIFPVYMFNTTDKVITDIKFQYEIDLSQIGGENLGWYQFQYNTNGGEENIPPKSIIPIFLGVPKVKSDNLKETYKGEELENIGFDVKNLFIYYEE